MKPTPLLPALIWSLVILAVIGWPEKQIPDSDILKIPFIDKVIHFSMFAVFAVFVYGGMWVQDKASSLYTYRLMITLTAGLAYGAVTEMIQHFFLEGRHGTAGDFLANAIGTVFGVIIIRKTGRTYLFGHEA